MITPTQELIPVEWKEIAIAALGAFSALLGWIARMLWDAVQKLRGDFAKLELRIAVEYVKKDDLKDRMSEALGPIKETLDEIKSWIREQRK